MAELWLPLTGNDVSLIGKLVGAGLIAVTVSVASATAGAGQIYKPEQAITATSTFLSLDDKLSIVPTFIANIEEVGNTPDSGLIAFSGELTKAVNFDLINEKLITIVALDASYKAPIITVPETGGRGYWRYDILLSAPRCLAIGYSQAPQVLVTEHTPQEPGKYHYDTLLSTGHCLALTKINGVSIQLVGANKKLSVLSVNSFWAAGIVPSPWVGEAIYLF